eukprot:11721732-Alexandrium_andersonii.AAC.1
MVLARGDYAAGLGRGDPAHSPWSAVGAVGGHGPDVVAAGLCHVVADLFVVADHGPVPGRGKVAVAGPVLP